MAVLVTGGAGYIGSHCVYELIRKGYEVVIVDNLSTGYMELIHKDAIFYNCDIEDSIELQNIFNKHNIKAVIHFASNSIVSESMNEPFKYFDNNVFGSKVLFNEMINAGVDKIIFSSSAAVYGNALSNLINETDNTKPTNVYGETKLMVESMLRWLDEIYGIKYVSLRYFNVSGSHPKANIGELHNPETHLIPLAVDAVIDKSKIIEIYGDDYKTRDGTCIRDYIHIMDLVNAHLKALDYLMNDNNGEIINIGSGHGNSVKEVINAIEKISNSKINTSIKKRRLGDPECLISSIQKAQCVLDWKPTQSDIQSIVKSTYDFRINRK